MMPRDQRGCYIQLLIPTYEATFHAFSTSSTSFTFYPFYPFYLSFLSSTFCASFRMSLTGLNVFPYKL
jgi:hypothetical protein